MNHAEPATHARSSFLLEVMAAPGGARVSLCPVRRAATATLRGYEAVAIDHRELERLTYELKVLLGRVNMRGQLDPAASAEIRKLGHLLFDELLPPSVKALLRAQEGHDLLIRTDESLVDVPWELLHTGEQFLALRWNIGRLLSAPSADAMLLPTPRPLRAPYSALLLADPCGDLDAAYDEGMQLHAMLDGQLYLDVSLKSSEIPRAYLRENIREFDLLHFAGHAELGGQGEGWLLSDGRFTTEDIERLTGGRPFPSLIFANACGSGRGGRRVEGARAATTLARTFISAGTRHFIGAHWDVPDAIAGTFATHFYRGLCQGLPVGHAMRQARLALSVTYGDGTVLWGSYCLYGDPGMVYFPEANGVERAEGPTDDFALPIVDDAPDVARGIYHTLDLPVGELLHRTAPASPYPELRSEGAMAIRPSRVTEAAADMKRGLLAVCGVAAALILAMVGYEAVSALGSVTPEASPQLPAQGAVRAATPAPSAPVSPSPAAAPSATAAAIQAQEEAERLAPPRITFDVTAQTRAADGDLVAVHLEQNTRLHSGDGLRVNLRSDRDVYVALVRLDPKRRTQLIFPHPLAETAASNYIRAGAEVPLPGADLWYRLDNNPGQETLLLLASKSPLKDLDALTSSIHAVMTRARRGHRGAGMVIRGEGDAARNPRRARRGAHAQADPSQYLSDIQSILDEHGIDVAKAVTYVHTR